MSEITFHRDDFIFMRENREIMSNEDFASYFQCKPWDISSVFTEMEYQVDWDMSTGEYEVQRCLNRFERAHQFGYQELNDCLALHERMCAN